MKTQDPELIYRAVIDHVRLKNEKRCASTRNILVNSDSLDIDTLVSTVLCSVQLEPYSELF